MNLPRYACIDDDQWRRVVVDLQEPASSDVTCEQVECVIDVDDFAEIAGIEVEDLRAQLGLPRPVPMEPIEGNRVRFSYDQTNDVMYVRVGGARAQGQILTDAQVCLDAKHALVRIEVRYPRYFPQPGRYP